MEFIDILKMDRTNDPDIVRTHGSDHRCIISVPHSGTLIPAHLLDHYEKGRKLLVDTDLYTDELHACDFGTSILFSVAPYVVNVSRARQGIQGTGIPAHLQKDPLHTGSLLGGGVLMREHTAAQKRLLMDWYDRFHEALLSAIKKMQEEKGYALLFDGHSLLSKGLKNTPDEGKERADFIVGTLGGSSADTRLTDFFIGQLQEQARRFGWTVSVDTPYKGGFITQHYADPEAAVHVFQIEVKRKLYLHEAFYEALPGEYERKKEGITDVHEVLATAYKNTADAAAKILGH
ncbi:MAG: N-formylglutamate amidohydrolase [Nanoarchaeota archaeon]